jgi:ribosomal protein S18 acetylase RimI-like enzyme
MSTITVRPMRPEDLPRVLEIALVCYGPIHDEAVRVLGEDAWRAFRGGGEVSWEERKIDRLRRWYQRHPDWAWVLTRAQELVGFAFFRMDPERGLGCIKTSGILPPYRGQGLGSFLYRALLDHFRAHGLRFAYVDTGAEDAHRPARRAYEAAGFRPGPTLVRYWLDLRPLGDEGKNVPSDPSD